MEVSISEMKKNVLYKNLNDNSLWRRNDNLEKYHNGVWIKIKITKEILNDLKLLAYKRK